MKPSGFYLMYIKSEPWTIISNLGYLLNIVYVYYVFLVWNNVESQEKISENAQGIQCEVVNVCTQKLSHKCFFKCFSKGKLLGSTQYNQITRMIF